MVGNFGVGWPGNSGEDQPVDWDFFKPVIDTMQAGDYLGLHEYWALGGPQENWTWWAGRFLQCPYDVPILITECGIDTGVSGQAYGGWQNLPGDEGQRAARYIDELWWYARHCLADGRVKGILPFTYDRGSSEWTNMDLRCPAFMTPFLARLAADPITPPPPEDEVPPMAPSPPPKPPPEPPPLP